MELTSQLFGETVEGPVLKFTLSSGNGLDVDVLNYGGIISAIRFPDRNGHVDDLVLGFDNLDGYLGDHPRFGEIIGRYGNRMANGRFNLDGHEFQLPKNMGAHTLHGGINGFGRYLWTARQIFNEISVGIELTRVSPHMEEGFPGNLEVMVQYLVDPQNRLTISYRATTDAPTVLNLTNHAYYNLKGHDQGDILDHELLIRASRISTVDEELIPTGTFTPVAGTPLDFTSAMSIGERIHADHSLIRLAHGYDHNFILDRPGSGHLAARVYEPVSGRVMEVFTDEPGIQLYTSNWLDGTIPGKGGYAYRKFAALCLETQHFPDSPNHPDFPSTRLDQGDVFRSETIHAFSAVSD